MAMVGTEKEELMNLSIFSLKSVFFTPKVFRILAAVELAAFALANAAQTSSPSQCCRFAPLGFPKMLKACFG
jgi:hypothetical protein